MSSFTERAHHHHERAGAVYLEDLALDEAQRRYWEALYTASAVNPVPEELVPLEKASGRVTAAPVWARTSSPHYHAAAMDGAALRAAVTRGASEAMPKRLRLDTDAVWVDTGDPMPADTDAVVMLEDIHDRGDGTLEVLAPVAPWQHVRAMGEDIVATELVVPVAHWLRPVDMAAIGAAGYAEVGVRRRPRLALIPTGDEMVPVGHQPGPGEIIEFNSLMLAAMAEQWGADVEVGSIQPDVLESLCRAVADALERCDIVVINAGSSAGTQDFTARVVEMLGSMVVHGVAIRPGHPVVLGVAQSKPLIGIPGYPVSAAMTFELFVRPIVDAMLGIRTDCRPRVRVRAVVPRKIVSPTGEDEFLRVKVGRVGDRLVAAPLERGAGIIMSLVRADGIVRIPRFSEGLPAGADVEVELLRDAVEVEHAVVVIGSHDPALELLANEVHRSFAPSTVASTNVGSLGGLVALKRGEAHAAGCHLIDPASGEYNIPDVRRLLEGRAVTLVNFAYRQQGLLVLARNPKGVHSLDDLTRPDIQFVNRQRGSGTRMLLDFELRRRGIKPETVPGYEREQYTHLSVAADVAGGAADVGLGVLAAARALDLDFVPILQERYDLVIPREYIEAPVLRPLLKVLRTPDFAAKVEAMGGYDVKQMGSVVAEIAPDPI